MSLEIKKDSEEVEEEEEGERSGNLLRRTLLSLLLLLSTQEYMRNSRLGAAKDFSGTLVCFRSGFDRL